MLNYKMKTYTIETTDGIYWVAEYPAVPGVIGTSKDIVEAVEDLIRNTEIHLEVLKEIGQSIPREDSMESENEYSGRLTLRTSKLMHKKIVELAKQEGISANQWMVESLSYAMGENNVRKDEVFPILEQLVSKIDIMVHKSREMFLKTLKTYNDKSAKSDGFVSVTKSYDNPVIQSNYGGQNGKYN